MPVNLNIMNNTVTALAQTSMLAGETPPGSWDLVSFGLYTLMAFGALGALMFLASHIGHKTRSEMKLRPYESGVDPGTSARLRFPVQFYLIAIFFIIFDLEAVFVYSWAVAFDELGWSGFAYITFFILMLMAGLVYVWKKKGLEWGPKA